MVENGSDGIDMTVPRPFYTRALSALDAAHNACFKHPERDILGMSHGPFAGVNVALGIVASLEDERAASLAEIERLRAALQKIAGTKRTDGFHTRQAQALQNIAADALGANQQTVTDSQK